MPVTSAIIGSSTGIGKALATAHLQQKIESITFSRSPEKIEGHNAIQLDLTDEENAKSTLEKAFTQYPDIEKVFLVSGTGDVEPNLNFQTASDTVELNCSGFTLAAYTAIEHFEKRGSGHLIAITSVAAVRGGGQSMSYNASKAYQSSLLEGLRCRVTRLKHPITITEVRAGFVDTAMMKAEKPFWVASPEQAANDILEVSNKTKDLVYVLKRWRIIAWLFDLLPNSLYKRIG
ncbi:MAG: hypothetical protein CMO55_24875 [Verrucomicrobiales bacterium]|nr:hypothetical protein [Verrucomicrobiales bacterium]